MRSALGRRNLQRIDDQVAVFAEQSAGAIHLGGGNAAGGVAQAVFEPGQDLALLGDLAPPASVGGLQAAHRGATTLLMALHRSAQLRFEGLDTLPAGSNLLLEGLALGVGYQAILGFWVGSVLHDLVNGVMLGEKLEAVLLPPAQA